MEIPGQVNYGGIFGFQAGDGSGDSGPAPKPKQMRWLVPIKKDKTAFEKGSAPRKPNMMTPYDGEFEETSSRASPASLYAAQRTST